MLRIATLVGLSLTLLVGCHAGLHSPLDPLTAAPDTPAALTDIPVGEAGPSRTGAAEIAGSVTLQGLSTTDPQAYASPFTVNVPGRSGEIALVTLATDELDSPGAGNSVRAVCKGPSKTHFTKNYLADTTPDYIPFLLLTTETLSLTLYNSEVPAASPHAQRVKWSGGIETVRKEDINEPNDDDNGATRDDRALGEPLELGPPYQRSLYRRTTGTQEDLEDWYRFSLTGGLLHQMSFTNENGKWGTWIFTVRVIDSTGTTVTYFSGEKTAGTHSLQFTPPTTGSYYVQVVGTPSTRKGTSVYYAPYTIQVEPLPVPTITNVQPQNVIGDILSPVTFSADVAGPITQWEWNFGGGASPSISTAARPVVRFNRAGVWTGSVRGLNNGAPGPTIPFSYRVLPSRYDWSARYIHETESSDLNYFLLPLPDGRMSFFCASPATGSPPIMYCASEIGDLDRWGPMHTIATSSSGGPIYGMSAAVINGRPALARYVPTAAQCSYVYAKVDLPTQTSDWSSAAVALTGTQRAYSPVLLNLGETPAIICALGSSGVTMATSSTATPIGSSWSTHTVIAGSGYGYGLSGVLKDGKPNLLIMRGSSTDINASQSSTLYFGYCDVALPSMTSQWHVYQITGGTSSYDFDNNDTGWRPTLIVAGDQFLGISNSTKGTRLNWSLNGAPTTSSHWRSALINNGSQALYADRHSAQSVTVVNGRVLTAFDFIDADQQVWDAGATLPFDSMTVLSPFKIHDSSGPVSFISSRGAPALATFAGHALCATTPSTTNPDYIPAGPVLLIQ